MFAICSQYVRSMFAKHGLIRKLSNMVGFKKPSFKNFSFKVIYRIASLVQSLCLFACSVYLLSLLFLLFLKEISLINIVNQQKITSGMIFDHPNIFTLKKILLAYFLKKSILNFVSQISHFFTFFKTHRKCEVKNL